MEVNKDEALRCLDIARRHLSSGNYTGARKFGLKSVSLFPTPEGEAFVLRIISDESTASYAESKPNTTRGSSDTGSAEKTGASSTGTSSSRPSTTPIRSRSTPVDHKPVERDFTPEQAAAVKTIRSSGGDFYKVLGVQKNATDIEIKKAYRKLALQMHPDKNGAPGADEAFKIVSKAFTVLSDSQKRAVFDQHGPDNGKSSGVNYDRATPSAQHSGYGRRGAAMNGFGEEMSPEELFNMFFGGGGGFGGSSFGGNGFSARSRTQQAQTHQQRQQHYRQQHQQQREQRANRADVDPASGFSSLIQLMPLILLIVITMSSNFFFSDPSSSSTSNPALSDFSLRPKDQFTSARHTTFRNVPYFVNEMRFMNTYFPGQQFEFKSSGSRQINVKPDQVTLKGQKVGPLFKQMEDKVELEYLRDLQGRCREEKRKKDIALNKAIGIWGADQKKLQEARRMSSPSCDVIREKFGKQYAR